jgi:hypothetical protein
MEWEKTLNVAARKSRMPQIRKRSITFYSRVRKGAAAWDLERYY